MRMEEADLADHPAMSTAALVSALLDEFSSVTDYRVLRDTLPHRLADLLRCRCVLLYLHADETLQFAAGGLAAEAGRSSAALLTVAHINPIALHAEIPEALAWRTQRAVITAQGPHIDAQISVPLLYRRQAIGVLTALRALPSDSAEDGKRGWLPAEGEMMEATARIVALLLENTRLLEYERARVQELSLLNGLTGQLNSTLREHGRVYRIVTQRAREIARPDLCVLLTPGDTAPAWLSPQAHEQLWRRWRDNQAAPPLLLERGSTREALTFMQHLDEHIKTCFAIPLIGKDNEQNERVLGILAGAYHRPRKLSRAETTLLQILANQAGTVLENIALMENLSKARNEARQLLHQILDDQRFKESILETIPSGLLALDPEGRITTFNRAAASVLGYHPREILGQPIHKILTLRDLSQQNAPSRRETLVTRGGQGQELALDVTLVPLRNERGEPEGTLVTFADMTDMRRLEAETRRLDRLAALGVMSANLAHEVRNPLAAIKTSVQMLRDDLTDDYMLSTRDDAREEIAVILKELERLDNLVRDLLLFARPHRPHAVEHDLGALCSHVLHVLEHKCKEQNVRVDLVRPPDLPSVSIDIAQMEQVLLNLFLNALQAMPDGGILSVTCHVLPDDTQTWDEEGEAIEQAWLELTISDTGVGIAHEALERIFEPFYTTRAHGIGLGLPITRRLVEDHRGTLTVESRLGYGTTVSLRLPLSKENSAMLPAEEEEEISVL